MDTEKILGLMIFFTVFVVTGYLLSKKNVEKNIQTFRQELIDIGATDPTLIAFGNITNDILERNLKGEFEKILKVPHYANYTSKERYREQVKKIW